MVKVAFGPRSRAPSWDWVGASTARELRKYFNVSSFGPREIPIADVVVVLKTPLSRGAMGMLGHRGTRVIFAPIDYFRDIRHIQEHAEFLRRCDLLLLHSEAMAPYFEGLAPTRLIEHHGKYFLPMLPPFKDKGFALWVGGFQYLPHLLHYLQNNRLGIPVKILTDTNCSAGRRSAITLARRLGVGMRFSGSTVNGVEMYRWSAQLQAKMMWQAKAAIDIKGDSFNQQSKPPTKAQKYICSGLPLAMNAGWSVQYFQRRGLCIPLPTDPRWLSREYYQEVCDTACNLRPQLSLETIGLQYKKLIEHVLRSCA
jgi:hypothetical protein